MRRSSEPEERAQFTVAELLARYGEPTPTTGRRRRRAADDTGAIPETAAEPIVAPNRVDRPDPTFRPSGPPLAVDAPARYGSSRPEPTRSQSTQPNLTGRAVRNWQPAVGPPPVAAQRAPVTSPVFTRPAPLARTVVPDGPATDRFRRFDPVPANPWASRSPVSTQAGSGQPGSAQPPAGLGTATRAIPEQNGDLAADYETGEHETGEHETAEHETGDAEAGSALWEWTVMVSQIGIGVAGGATLWLICEWLWQRIPVVALVVALAVITGLVWVVRRVRRAEDLQTTVIAVLVGLFVTVSPAALLLVGR